MALRLQGPLATCCCHRLRLFPHFRPNQNLHVLQRRRWTSLFTSTTSISPGSRSITTMAKRGASFRQIEIASPEDMQFETPLKIVEYPDPVLRATNKRIDTFDENLKRLAEEMFDVMYKTDGIGLSAPQVGINVQLMVFNPVGVRGEGEEVILVNPKIYKYSKKIVLFDEGCLSFPGIYGDIERPASVKIEARDITGAKFSICLSGLPARVFQHEFDHLEGILFFERMDDDVLDHIIPQLQVLEKNMRIELECQVLKNLKNPEE